MKHSYGVAENTDADRATRYQVEYAVVLENAMYIDFEIALSSDDLETCLSYARKLASQREYENAVILVWDRVERCRISMRPPLALT